MSSQPSWSHVFASAALTLCLCMSGASLWLSARTASRTEDHQRVLRHVVDLLNGARKRPAPAPAKKTLPAKDGPE